MAYSNVIVNGSFNQGNTGWTGSDLETNYAENAYLGNGSQNRVAEMDGRSGQTTVMAQSITVTDNHTTSLNFRTALRNASAPGAGEGFRVDIVDSSGVVITTQSFFPTSTSWTTQSLPVTFPVGGTYTIRLTELGPNDSLGAIIDDVSMLLCFTAGTLIETAQGARAVETLVPGDMIWTNDSGMQPLLWSGHRVVRVAEQISDARLRPIVFQPGSLAPGLPLREMQLSPHHRLCRQDWRAELYFGEAEVLVSAQALVNGGSIRVAPPLRDVTYVHILLDGHQIVRSDGVLCESFFPSPMALGGVTKAAHAELLRLFPDIGAVSRAYPQTVRPVLRNREAELIG